MLNNANHTKCRHCTTVINILISDQLEMERRSLDAKSGEDASILVDAVIELGDLIMELEDQNCSHDPIPESETIRLIAEMTA
jgi:hypothetical protein